jgi:hypothetical protein
MVKVYQSNPHLVYKPSVYDFLLANMHSVETTDDVNDDDGDNVLDNGPEDDVNDTRLINAAKSKGKSLPPGDIWSI